MQNGTSALRIGGIIRQCTWAVPERPGWPRGRDYGRVLSRMRSLESHPAEDVVRDDGPADPDADGPARAGGCTTIGRRGGRQGARCLRVAAAVIGLRATRPCAPYPGFERRAELVYVGHPTAVPTRPATARISRAVLIATRDVCTRQPVG